MDLYTVIFTPKSDFQYFGMFVVNGLKCTQAQTALLLNTSLMALATVLISSPFDQDTITLMAANAMTFIFWISYNHRAATFSHIPHKATPLREKDALKLAKDILWLGKSINCRMTYIIDPTATITEMSRTTLLNLLTHLSLTLLQTANVKTMHELLLIAMEHAHWTAILRQRREQINRNTGNIFHLESSAIGPLRYTVKAEGVSGNNLEELFKLCKVPFWKDTYTITETAEAIAARCKEIVALKITPEQLLKQNISETLKIPIGQIDFEHATSLWQGLIETLNPVEYRTLYTIKFPSSKHIVSENRVTFAEIQAAITIHENYPNSTWSHMLETEGPKVLGETLPTTQAVTATTSVLADPAPTPILLSLLTSMPTETITPDLAMIDDFKVEIEEHPILL